MTERIGDLCPPPNIFTFPKPVSCSASEHHPDKRNLSEGRYKHTCPVCGEIEYFEIYPQGVYF